ncbi:hypothetical protein [Colwellia sp. E2M01]|uniref:hypothetical protein n=1 Tax=Colwellia sp. E2M01 TaxID=2841561 RepID=UPI001C0963EE|nr:hypothetical protein [Colwellia sp. E2M01]MBU2871873.1 hypothetical protein [Colwellia sp. E2M01]
MKFKNLNTLLIGFTLAMSGIVNVANAGLIAFNDRATFESYLSGVVTDDLSSIGSVAEYSDSETLNDFTISGDMYRCHSDDVCYGPYNNLTAEYLWVDGSANFSFNTGIVGFGFDFDADDSKAYGNFLVANLNGLTSTATNTGGFFGIVSDDGSTFSDINFTPDLASAVFDNVTYATALAQPIAVSTPAAFIILVLSMMGLIARKLKK